MSLDTDAASSELRNQGTGRAYTSGFGNSSAEFRRQGQFRRQGPADLNSGVRNSSAEFRRQGQFRRQGPADPNSGVRNSSAEFRRQGQFRRQGPADLNSGVRNSSAEFRRQGRRQGPADPNSGVRNSSAEFRRQGQFRRQGPADPNSGVRNSSAEFKRQGQFRRQGPADPNSGVKNPSDEFRRHQLRFAWSPYLFAFCHGRQARGGRNSGVKFRRQKHFRRHLSENRFQASAWSSSAGRNLFVSGRPDQNLGVEFERQPNLGVNSSAPNLGATFELQIRASGGDEMGTQIPVSLHQSILLIAIARPFSFFLPDARVARTTAARFFAFSHKRVWAGFPG